MDIQNFIEEFKKTFVYDLLSMTLKDEQLFEHFIDEDGVTWFKEQTRQMWSMWEKAKAQAVQEGFEIGQLKDRITELLDERQELYAQINAQAVPEGFVLVEKQEFEEMKEFEDLYRRAIINSRKSIHEVNWSHVSNLGVGSTRARKICERFDIDPDATFRKKQEPTQ